MHSTLTFPLWEHRHTVTFPHKLSHLTAPLIGSPVAMAVRQLGEGNQTICHPSPWNDWQPSEALVGEGWWWWWWWWCLMQGLKFHVTRSGQLHTHIRYIHEGTHRHMQIHTHTHTKVNDAHRDITRHTETWTYLQKWDTKTTMYTFEETHPHVRADIKTLR